MNLTRYLSTDLIKLEMEPPLPLPEDPEANLEKFRQQQKEKILAELVALLERSGRVTNKRKLLTDLINRERRATTALGRGLAVPHVRTSNIRDLTLAIARSSEGLDFDAVDGQPTHIFFVVVAPPQEDENLYLRIYKHLAEISKYHNAVEQLLAVQDPGEMIRLLRQWE
ncbi:MAG: PTS sugar transporter subunit IIA [candidate division KSB1 bacterium]|nr:PTS sugar transporter subunit IIA [candidate division KSB1 bacterium]MDZ7272981.1 PTS sugar transporter subunit IIA [candidate division KSB1 bacterium]MDZ7285085.1 PTS sugar transporter subunit IIA [candidate division KSB1 bacterium]MDZ7298117.1 PTS sugar transporter subunit IIA [candidate division KSB1 bacterium]MDZ7309331.1 PTS sugar transporter subunit IIA [candidate division KSB1 bacterium]